jgi:hypothetical protein
VPQPWMAKTDPSSNLTEPRMARSRWQKTSHRPNMRLVAPVSKYHPSINSSSRAHVEVDLTPRFLNAVHHCSHRCRQESRLAADLVVARVLISCLLDHLDYFFDFLHRKQIRLRLLRVVSHADDRLDYFFKFLHRKQLGLRLIEWFSVQTTVSTTSSSSCTKNNSVCGSSEWFSMQTCAMNRHDSSFAGPGALVPSWTACTHMPSGQHGHSCGRCRAVASSPHRC